MDQIDRRSGRFHDGDRESKIRWDMTSKLHRDFDSFTPEMNRGIDGVRHHLRQNTHRVERDMPRRPPAWVCEGHNEWEYSFREENRHWVRSKVPILSEFSTKENLLEWPDAVESFFGEMRPPENLKCKLASYALEGETERWWKQLQHQRIMRGESKVTFWSQMKFLLINDFWPTICSTKCPLRVCNTKLNEKCIFDPPVEFSYPSSFTMMKETPKTERHVEKFENTKETEKQVFMSSRYSIVCLSQATTAAEVSMKFIEGNKEEKSTKDSKKDDEHSEEANEINGEAEAVIHTKQEEGHELVKFLQSSSFLPAKCSTNFPSESYSSRWNEVRELGILDLVKGTNMVETHEKAVLCMQTSKLKDHHLSGHLDFELNTNRVLIGHMQEESDSEAAKLKLEYKVTFMNNGTLPTDVYVLFYLPRSFRELNFVSKDQNLKLFYGVGSNIRLEGIVWLIRVVVILKLHLGRNKHMRYLIFGERMVSSYSIDEIGLLSFDPGGNPIAQKAGNYLFTSYGILLKNEATNDRILLNIARLNGESEANEPTVAVNKELVFGISGFKGSGLLYVGKIVKKMDRNLQLIIIPHPLINSSIN